MRTRWLAIAMITVACGACAVAPPDTGTVTANATTGDAAAQGDASERACDPACGAGFTCCGGVCIDLANDPRHCGTCETSCAASTRFCAEGACTRPSCNRSLPCANSGACCGDECCTEGAICCVIGGAGIQHTACVNGTVCPSPCPTCR